jgi:diguanylate cyclase (GGDEF)-like protein/PAS domain S-box-containing protein
MKLFHGTSLRTRITIGMLLAVLLTLWLVTLVASRMLRSEMEAAISAQQFSAVSLAAREVDRSLSERIAAVEEVAGRLRRLEMQPDQLQRFLDERIVFPQLFNWGVMILDADGTARASVPARLNRVGVNYRDLPTVQTALEQGRAMVTDPLVGRATGQPVVSVTAPIRDATGRVVGLVMGITNLAEPNFLDAVGAAKYGATGDFLITAPNSRVFVASSDKRRVMQKGPPVGVNPLYDRYLEGYEGSGLAVSSHGVLELSSNKRIPSTGWLMQSVLPAEEAFAPVANTQRRLLGAAVIITLLAGGASAWWLRRQLHPVREASNLLARMGDGSLPRQPLPVRRHDEVGQLADAFNGLLVRILAEEERAAEHAANERLRKIVAHVPGVVFQYRIFPDGHGCFPFASEAFKDIYGVAPEDVTESADVIRNMALPEDRDRFFASLHASAESMELWRVDYRIRRPDGVVRWLLVEAMPELENGLVTWYGFIADSTDAKATEENLRIAATTFLTLEGIMVTDERGVILRVNPAFTEITGYPPDEVVGRTPAVLRSNRHDAAFYRALWTDLLAKGVWQGEIINRRRSGESYPQWLTITAVKDAQGTTTHYVGVFQDITARKAAEEEIRNLAFYDPLTHLPNRRLLLDRLQQAVAASSRNGRYGALLFLDLDNFKTLNDSLGHDMGDRLLVEVAGRLQACVREGDTVARLGGDEFVLMVQDLSQTGGEAAAQAESTASKVLEALNRPYQLGSQEYRGSSSIGVALFSGREVGIDELLKRADLAMYQAKSAGRNTLRFFDPGMQARINQRSTMEGELHRALAEREFVLHYQPQIDRANRCIGVEALIRWRNPGRGLVAPAEFIPLAEECGLIQPIGRWVVEQACERLAEWARDPLTADLIVAINVSAKQFRQDDFIEQLREAIRRFAANPLRLKLELTESLLLHDIDDAIAKMLALRGLGVTFSLDDFGTGYSSLSYLKRLPLDQIKIDRSFVNDVLTDPNDAAICKAVIALGKSLGLSVVAEGVETANQWELLREEGCTAVQGYLFGYPMSEPDFLDWLRRRDPESRHPIGR